MLHIGTKGTYNDCVREDRTIDQRTFYEKFEPFVRIYEGWGKLKI